MIPDAECVRVMAEILTELKLGKFVIKVCVCRVTCFVLVSWKSYHCRNYHR